MDGEVGDVQEPLVLEFRHRIFNTKSEDELEVVRKNAEAAGKLSFITDDLDSQKKHLEYVARRTGQK